MPITITRGQTIYRQADIQHIPYTWPDGDTTPRIDTGHYFKTGSTVCTVTEFTYTPGPAVLKRFYVIIMVDGFAFEHEGGSFADCTKIWCPGAKDRSFKAGDIVNFVWDGTRAIMKHVTLAT